MSHDQYPTHEDPLAGDVDHWVHPDETRSDEQIAHDEKVTRDLHMSGDDGADEYWKDYDEYFGTVNGLPVVIDGGQQPHAEVTRATIGTTTPGTWEHIAANTRTVVDVDGREHQFYGPSERFQGKSDEEIAAELRDSKLKRKAAEDRQAYQDALDEEAEQEDPLAGDVDHWVHPDETKD